MSGKNIAKYDKLIKDIKKKIRERKKKEKILEEAKQIMKEEEDRLKEEEHRLKEEKKRLKELERNSKIITRSINGINVNFSKLYENIKNFSTRDKNDIIEKIINRLSELISINTNSINRNSLSYNSTKSNYYPSNLSSFRQAILPEWIPEIMPNFASLKKSNTIIHIESKINDTKSPIYGPVFVVIINRVIYFILVMINSKNIIIYSDFRSSR